MAIVLQLFIVAAIIVFKASVIAGGTTVLFKVEPVDPRDIFRGDYMILSYEDVSRLDRELFKSEKIKRGDNVYAELKQNGRFWEVARVISRKPDKGTLFMKGSISGSRSKSVLMTYQIENYFIPEGSGQNINLRDSNPYVEVAIDKEGNAVLKKLYIYDEPFESMSREEIKNLQEETINQTKKQSSADARSLADIKQIQLGLEIYFDGNKKYPMTLEELVPNIMKEIPKSPVNGSDYDYCSDKIKSYVLGAMMFNRIGANELIESSNCDPNKDTICGQNGYFCAGQTRQ